jgi:hypothetical protein
MALMICKLDISRGSTLYLSRNLSKAVSNNVNMTDM